MVYYAKFGIFLFSLVDFEFKFINFFQYLSLLQPTSAKYLSQNNIHPINHIPTHKSASIQGKPKYTDLQKRNKLFNPIAKFMV